VGMKDIRHLRANLELAQKPPLTTQEFIDIISKNKAHPIIEQNIEY
jgi:hypothetical protein